MKPKTSPAENRQGDLFRVELCTLVDPAHGLIKLADTVPWARLEERFGALFCEDNGRPAHPTRLLVALHYLKYAYDLSDADVVSGWIENPYWQYLSGMQFFEHRRPLEPSSLTRWRQRVGQAGAEALLSETIAAGLMLRAITPAQLQRVNVDTTVQEAHVRFPTDARLYERARRRLVTAARRGGIRLRQSYTRVGKWLLLQVNRYAHARQIKRAARCTKQLKTLLGRTLRDIARQLHTPDPEMQTLMTTGQKIFEQQRKDSAKIYSVHAPHIECIAKGKAHKRYEFGCKVALGATSRGGWWVAARAMHGNPYDGHTLAETLEQIERVARRAPRQVFADRGFRGHDYAGPIQVHLDRARRGALPKALWGWIKRRAAIEPGIGHLKQEHRMDRNRLHSVAGDMFNAILSAAGMNFRKLVAHAAALRALLLALVNALLPRPPRAASRAPRAISIPFIQAA
jgi:IS5 family transposase